MKVFTGQSTATAPTACLCVHKPLMQQKKPCYQHIFFDHKSSVIVTLVKITEHNFGLGTLRQGVGC